MRIAVLAAGLVLIALALVGGLAGRGGDGTSVTQRQPTSDTAQAESSTAQTSETVAARTPSPYQVYNPLPSAAGRELLTPFRFESDPAARALGERGRWGPLPPDSVPSSAEGGASALVHASLPAAGTGADAQADGTDPGAGADVKAPSGPASAAERPQAVPARPSAATTPADAAPAERAPAERAPVDASRTKVSSVEKPAVITAPAKIAPATPTSSETASAPPASRTEAPAVETPPAAETAAANAAAANAAAVKAAASVSAPAATGAASPEPAESETAYARLTPQAEPPAAPPRQIQAPPARPPAPAMARAPVTAAPAPVNTPPVALAPPVEESQAPPAQAEPEVPAVTVSSDVADAQRLLARLGYNVGPADGYTGPRTAAAVRAFQQANGMWADGVIDEALLVALEDKADERDQRLRPAWKTQGAVMPPAPSIATGRDSLPPTAHRSPSTARSSTTGSGESENTVSSIVSGLQRMIGHEFDSVHAPGDLRAFCNAHSDNWVYDEGTGRFLFCAEVNAGIVGDSRQVVRPR